VTIDIGPHTICKLRVTIVAVSISASICLLLVVLLYAPLAEPHGRRIIRLLRLRSMLDSAHHHQKIPPDMRTTMDCGHDMTGMMAAHVLLS